MKDQSAGEDDKNDSPIIDTSMDQEYNHRYIYGSRLTDVCDVEDLCPVTEDEGPQLGGGCEEDHPSLAALPEHLAAERLTDPLLRGEMRWAK